MKTFCFKTNNEKIINYLLNKIKEIDFENLIYSKNQFKIYSNIIIHYTGKEYNKFYDFLQYLIKELVIEFYEERLLKYFINYNYFYFEKYEKIKILENCNQLIEPEIYESTILKKQDIKNYIKQNKCMILEGFVFFRMKDYLNYLDSLVDTAVNKFIIEKEYKEFISLLKMYVDSKQPEYNFIHLIYINGESILLDENKNIISISDNIYNAKYLSDISFSSNDVALNTILNLLPKKIEIHLIDKEDEFINTLKLIFENKVFICKECDICKTYKILNTNKIGHNVIR